MFKYEKVSELNDYFKACSRREKKGTYFCRLVSYNEQIQNFLIQYIKETKKNGVYIKGKIPNPDKKQLAFYEEMVGAGFQTTQEFILSSMQKWLPRLTQFQRIAITEALLKILNELKAAGKNDNMLKNSFIKFMCWFYYKFERILNQLGKDQIPKILYEGNISEYELKAIRILVFSGCDALLVQAEGDDNYRRLDPSSSLSQLIEVGEKNNFPKDISIIDLDRPPGQNSIRLKAVRKEPAVNQDQERRCGPVLVASNYNTKTIACNTWITGEIFEDSLKTGQQRASSKAYYYNLFARIYGVENKSEYFNDLLRWKLKLENSHRKFEIIEQQIRMPDVSEVQKVHRGNYMDRSQLMNDILRQIQYPKCMELENLLKKAFTELMKEETGSLQVLGNRAVCMLCWLNRYIPKLFKDWKLGTYPVFIYYGVCRNENETMFLRLLSRIPVDVLILCPDKDKLCKLKDDSLYEKVYQEGMELGKFPESADQLSFSTAAYNAEQDLNTLMYQDTGMYRNRQFKRAIPVTLSTTYEEISILWDQEAKYRPNFETLSDRVMLPVIFAKISGVKNSDRNKYWESAAKLVTEDTCLITKLPFMSSQEYNPVRAHAASFFKNGKLQVQKIKQHPSYRYGYIREDMQDYMFDKLQQLIESRLIQGTLTQGTEYTIISTVLNLNKNVLRMIQKFDFTRQIPKLILINTAEDLCSLEDSIFTAFMNLLGFDVLLLIPTGYQSVERFYTKPVFIEHQEGDYIYDMHVPDLRQISDTLHRDGFIGKIFKRGR